MKLVFTFTPSYGKAELKEYPMPDWEPSDGPGDLELDIILDYYQHDLIRGEDAEQRNFELMESIIKALRKQRWASGSEQIIEEPNMNDAMDYMGTVHWELVAETPQEASWIVKHGYRLQEGGDAGKAVPEDVATINRHRASIGADPIDPNAGWTPDELRRMAESIRTKGTEHNPEPKRLATTDEKLQAMQWATRWLYDSAPDHFVGACAETSFGLAAFATALGMDGVNAVFGTARTGSGTWDHAWITVDGKVFDPRGWMENRGYKGHRPKSAVKELLCDPYEEEDWIEHVLPVLLQEWHGNPAVAAALKRRGATGNPGLKRKLMR